MLDCPVLDHCIGPYSAIPYHFWTSGPVHGELPNYQDSAELIHAPIPRNGSGKPTTTTILDINYKTVFRIINVFNSTGRIEAKGQGSDNRVKGYSKLNPEQKQIILSWVHENCLLYQKLISTNLKHKYKSHFGCKESYFDCKESHFDWETYKCKKNYLITKKTIHMLGCRV